MKELNNFEKVLINLSALTDMVVSTKAITFKLKKYLDFANFAAGASTENLHK